jgi:hypothetical protein
MRNRRAGHFGAAVAAALMAGALPATAGAADYCVAPNTSCDGGNVASLQLALDLADQLPDADRIFLGAATYTAPTAGGFRYDKPEWPVEIIGKGIGQTVLTGPAGGSGVLGLEASAGSSVHDLTIRLPQNAADGAHGLVTSNVARRIEVVEHPTQANGPGGVELHHGGTLEDSTVTIGPAHNSIGLRLGEGGGTVRRSTLSAARAVVAPYGGTVDRSRLTGLNSTVQAAGGVLELTRSLVRFEHVGIYAGANYEDTAVKADGVTLAGADVPGARGAEVSAGTANADVTLANSIIRGAKIALKAVAAGPGQARIGLSYSDYDSSYNAVSGPGASISETSVSHVGDARFADAAGGDFRLLAGSPLVDAGDPATAQGLDLDGNALVADGDGDGAARRDLGAFEHPPAPAGGGQPGPAVPGPTAPAGGQPGGSAPADAQAPLIGAFRAAPSVFAVARARAALAAGVRRGTRFRYTLSEPARVTLRIRRARRGGYRTIATLARTGAGGANRIRFTGRIGRRALRPGRYRALLTATDAAGNRSAPRATRFRIARG